MHASARDALSQAETIFYCYCQICRKVSRTVLPNMGCVGYFRESTVWDWGLWDIIIRTSVPSSLQHGLKCILRFRLEFSTRAWQWTTDTTFSKDRRVQRKRGSYPLNPQGSYPLNSQLELDIGQLIQPLARICELGRGRYPLPTNWPRNGLEACIETSIGSKRKTEIIHEDIGTEHPLPSEKGTSECVTREEGRDHLRIW
jgi:hypothetical protein